MKIVWDHDRASRYQLANFLISQTLVFRNFHHLLGDNTLARSFDLGHLDTSAILDFGPRSPRGCLTGRHGPWDRAKGVDLLDFFNHQSLGQTHPNLPTHYRCATETQSSLAGRGV